MRRGSLHCHGRAYVLAAYDAGEIPGIVEIEYPQRQAVVAAHDDGRGIHDVELVGEHLVEGQVRVAHGSRIAQRIIGIHAVHLGGLQQHVGVDLDGAQRGGGVGGEERVAGAGGKDRHATLLQVPHRAAPDVVLADFVDADRGHDPGMHPQALECVLHGECIHHCGEHAHVVGRDPVHAGTRQPRAAEDVAAADHHRDLHTHLRDVLQFPGDAPDDRRFDAVVPISHQGLTREFHQDSRVVRLGLRHLFTSADGKNPAHGGVCTLSSARAFSAGPWGSRRPASSRCRRRPRSARTPRPPPSHPLTTSRSSRPDP